MKKIELGQVITILANLGVIAGIVFLAIEVQQNTDSLNESRNLAMAQAQQERASRLDESFRSLANSEFLPEIFVKYRTQGRDALTAEELQRFIWQSCSGITRINTIHAWYERGYIDEEEYEESIRRLVVQFAPRWSDIGIAPTRPAFRREVERILEEAQLSVVLPATTEC